MTPQDWYTRFIKRFSKSNNFKNIKPIGNTRKKWTSAITSLIHRMGEEMGFYCYCKKNKGEEKELLTIDFMWFSKETYKRFKFEREYYFPNICIEHETYASKYTNSENVKYSFWKSLCVRSEINVLIAYFVTNEEQRELIEGLQNILDNIETQENINSVLVLLGKADEINKTRDYDTWILNGKSLVKRGWGHP